MTERPSLAVVQFMWLEDSAVFVGSRVLEDPWRAADLQSVYIVFMKKLDLKLVVATG